TYQRAGRHIQPDLEAGEQKTQRRAAAEQRQCIPFRGRQGPRLDIALQHGAALGDVEGMIHLETPGVETNRDVVSQSIDAGKVEIDEAREPVAEKKDVV